MAAAVKSVNFTLNALLKGWTTELKWCSGERLFQLWQEPVAAWIYNAGGLERACLWRWCQTVCRCLTVNISGQTVTTTPWHHGGYLLRSPHWGPDVSKRGVSSLNVQFCFVVEMKMKTGANEIRPPARVSRGRTPLSLRRSRGLWLPLAAAKRTAAAPQTRGSAAAENPAWLQRTTTTTCYLVTDCKIIVKFFLKKLRNISNI